MSSQFRDIRALFSLFDPDHLRKRTELLRKMGEKELSLNNGLIKFYDDLLFIHAHPANAIEERLAWKNLRRIEQFLRKYKSIMPPVLENSGLPFTAHTSKFSWELLCWLSEREDIKMVADFTHTGDVAPAEIIRPLLPSTLRYEHGFEADWQELFDNLKFLEPDPLKKILLLFQTNQMSPLVRDLLFGQLDLYTSIYPKTAGFSKMHNCIEIPQRFYHNEILKKYDFTGWLEKKLPPAEHLNAELRESVASKIKISLALLLRETDPSTFIDLSSLHLFHLERGISVAIYGMVSERQLPYESYIGFTLFKNGYPAAYGGAWVFGRRAKFGINIFETFRGGESGMFFTQILRVYARCFEIDHFEIESYQFGADNPEGIVSGAYWFYYKHGFRSTDKKLAAIAEKEAEKIQRNKSYRTSLKILEEFTKSNMELLLKGISRPDVTLWTSATRRLLQKKGVENTLSPFRYQNPAQSKQNSVKEQYQSQSVSRDEWSLLVLSGPPFNHLKSEKIDRIIEFRNHDMLGYQRELRDMIDTATKAGNTQPDERNRQIN